MPNPPTHPPLTPLRAACNTPTRAARSAKRRARTPPSHPHAPGPSHTHARPNPARSPPPSVQTRSAARQRAACEPVRAHTRRPPAPTRTACKAPKSRTELANRLHTPTPCGHAQPPAPPKFVHTHTQSVCPVCKHGLRTPLLSKHAGSAAMCPGGTDGVPRACKPQKVTTCQQLWLLPSAEHRHCSTGARCPPQAGFVPTVHEDTVVARWVVVLPGLCHPLSAVPRWKPLWS